MTVDAPADPASKPFGSGSDLATPEGAVGDSLSVAIWTFISRFTGVLRGITIAAVLGATYFANTYQFTNSLPNLIFYGLLAGSLFSSLLVPALVEHVDSGDKRAAARTGRRTARGGAGRHTGPCPHRGAAHPVAAPAGRDRRHRRRGRAQTGTARRGACTAPAAPGAAVRRGRHGDGRDERAPALRPCGRRASPGKPRHDRGPRRGRPCFTRGRPSRAAFRSRCYFFSASGRPARSRCMRARNGGVRGERVWLLSRTPGWRDPNVRATIRRALPAVIQAALAALQDRGVDARQLTGCPAAWSRFS